MIVFIIKLILLIIPLTVLFVFMRTLPGSYSSRNASARKKKEKKDKTVVLNKDDYHVE